MSSQWGREAGDCAALLLSCSGARARPVLAVVVACLPLHLWPVHSLAGRGSLAPQVSAIASRSGAMPESRHEWWDVLPPGLGKLSVSAREGTSATVLMEDIDPLVRMRRLNASKLLARGGEPYGQAAIQLELSGPYVAVKRSLSDLLARHPGLAVRTLELQRLRADRGGGAEVALRAELRLFERSEAGPLQPQRP